MYKRCLYCFLFLLFSSASNAELNEQEFNKLKTAVSSADIEIVKQLIPKIEQEEINYEVDRNGMTWLHLAINTKPERVLSDDPNKKYDYFYPDNYPIIKLLLERDADLKIKDQLGRTPLLMLFSNKKKSHETDLRILDLLLNNGAEINDTDYNGNNLFHLILRKNNNNELIKELTKRKLNINMKNSRGETPLHKAFNRNADYYKIKALIEAGADVKTSNSSGVTPLHLAARNTNQKIVDYLLKNGAELDIKDNKNMTPLSYAVQAKKWRIAETLIKKGADINVKAGRNDSIASVILSNSFSGLSELIKESGYDPNFIAEGQVWPLYTAIRQLNLEKVKSLIDSGVDVNLKNGTEYAALPALAVSYRKSSKNKIRVEIFKQLIAAGIDVDSKDKNGSTLLHNTIKKNDVALVELLLNEGVNPNTQGLKNLNPYTLAVKYRSFSIAELLLNKGADTIDWNVGYPRFDYLLSRYDRNTDNQYKSTVNKLIVGMLKSDFTFNLDDHLGRNLYELIKKIDDKQVQDQLGKAKISFKEGGVYDRKIKKNALTKKYNKQDAKTSVEPVNKSKIPDYLKESLSELPEEQRNKLLSVLNKNNTASSNAEKENNCSFDSLPEEFDVYAVGTYKGTNLVNIKLSNKKHNVREAEVLVNRPGKSTVLVLMAYDPVIWKVKRTKNSNIAGVIVGAYHTQQVIGIEKNIPIIEAVHENKSDCPYFYAYKAGRNLDKAIRNIKNITGKQIEKFITKPVDNIFVVGSKLGTKNSDLIYKVDKEHKKYDKKPLPEGLAGLKVLENQKKIKLASPANIDAWVDAASAKYKKMGKDLKVSHYMRVGATYVILKDLYLPDGLYGAHSVSFIIPKGVPRPDGPPGHNQFYFMEGGFCTLGFATECPGS